MALDHGQDAKLFDVLAGGYDLTTRLQELLSSPLDIRGQQAAIAFSQELLRVFKESMSLLNSSTVTPVKTNSTGTLSIPARDKRIRNDSGEVAAPLKKNKEDGVTRKEITPSPHKDGYEWRKYGQKNIQNCKFVRYYYKCSRDRRCEAKKKVQQRDDGRDLLLLPPMFEVTYVNDHTCHVLRANDDAAAAAARNTVSSSSSPRRTTNHYFRAFGVVDTARRADGDEMFPSFGGGGGGSGSAAEENDAIVSCLAAVIGGAFLSSPPSPMPPPAPSAVEASASNPAAAHYYYVPPQQAGVHSAAASLDGSAADDGAAAAMTTTTTTLMAESDYTGFSWEWDLCPAVAEEEADDATLMMMNQHNHRDVHVDVVARRFPDTVWPRGAWR